MGTTNPFAWPYPEPTAIVRNGAADIQSLGQSIATSLNNRGLTSRCIGGSTVTTSNGSGTGSVGFTGFSVSPAVVANSGDSAAGIRIDIISTVLTGFNYRVLNQTTGAVVPNATVRINWVAIGATAAA
jgi:hypothetical protein